LSEVGAHDVDDDIEEVEDDPIGLECAVDGARPDVMLDAETIADFLDDGAQVRLAGAGSEDEEVGDGGEITHVEDDEILRFFIISEFAAEQSQFSSVHRALILDIETQR